MITISNFPYVPSYYNADDKWEVVDKYCMREEPHDHATDGDCECEACGCEHCDGLELAVKKVLAYAKSR